jgi:hypothetical protein
MKIRFFLISLLIFSIAVGASSCIKGHFMEGNIIQEDNISRIQNGVTTREEILKWFGPPVEYQDPETLKMIMQTLDLTADSMAVTHPFEDAFIYEHVYAKTSGVFALVAIYLKTDTKRDVLIVFFDENDKVKYYAFRKGTLEFE